MYQALLDRKPQDRQLRSRLHLFGPSGRGGGGTQGDRDLCARAHRRMRPRTRRRSSRRGSPRSAQHPLVGEARGSGSWGRSSWSPTSAASARSTPMAGVGARACGSREEEGLIVRFLAGDAVSICPPLIITPAEIDELFDRLGRALDRTLEWVRRTEIRLRRRLQRANGAGRGRRRWPPRDWSKA